MGDYRLIGIDAIAIGTSRTTTTGGMSATLTTIESIVPGSARLQLAMPAKTDLMVEDSDYPDITVYSAGEKFVEFATRDMDPTLFELGLGGSTSGTTSWVADDTPVIVQEKCIRLKSKSYGGSYATIDIVRANLMAGADLQFTKTESGMLTFRADILRPLRADTDPPIKIVWS